VLPQSAIRYSAFANKERNNVNWKLHLCGSLLY